MTQTRCSSTPSAETLVKPAGSTTRTTPSSVPTPPQRSNRTRVPAPMRTASADNRSTSTSSTLESPISMSDWPALTVPSLLCVILSTCPSTGARMAIGLALLPLAA